MAIDFNKPQKIEIPKELLINISIAGISVIFLIILWIFTSVPQNKEINQVNKKIKSMSSINEDMSLKLKREKKKLQANKNELSQKIAEIEGSLYKEKDITTILDRLIETAKRKKLEFISIKPVPVKIREIKEKNTTIKMKELPISLEMQAGFSEFTSFLKEVEDSKNSLDITKISIQKGNKEKHKETLSISLYQLLKSDDEKEIKNKK